MREDKRKVEVVAVLWIDEDADVSDVIQEMDYSFDHPSIRDTEIIDINTEA